MSSLTAPTASAFVVTKEYRRFAEFCEACRRYHYIGLCYGTPGVGKTISARYYAKWDWFEPFLPRDNLNEMPPPEIIDCHTIFYTPPITSSPGRIEKEVAKLRFDVSVLSAAALQLKQGNLDWWMEPAPADRTELILVDKADRLKFPGLEQLRDIYDRSKLGLILIGMPGLEKRLSRYAQFYSRVGFVHHFQALSQEELRFILEKKWAELGLTFNPNEFTNVEALSAIIRITGGNFRLLQRLFSQIERILQINQLQLVTKEVVEAARESLVIGT